MGVDLFLKEATNNVLFESVFKDYIIKQLTFCYGFPPTYVENRLKKLPYGNSELSLFGLMTADEYPYILFFVTQSEYSDTTENKFLRYCKQYELSAMAVLFSINSGTAKYFRKNFQKDEFEYVSDFEKYTKKPTTAIYGNAHRFGISLQPLSSKVESLFFDAHSIIRDTDGMHADEALDELCKFIYAKLFDEEHTSKGSYYQSQVAIYNSQSECVTNFRLLYVSACAYGKKALEVYIPKHEKSSGVFGFNIKLSNTALYKLISLFETSSLSISDLDVKGRAFQKLYSPALRSGMGQYFTPLPIIRFIVNVIAPQIKDFIIDPFAGSGHFLTTSFNYILQNSTGEELSKINEFAFCKLHGIEKSERMVRIAMTDMRLLSSIDCNIRCTDALLSFDNYENLKANSFDIVLSNPPFGSILSKESFAGLGHFDLLEGRNTLPLETLGLERCIQLLRPNGKFSIVLPESVITNKNQDFVRIWLLSKVELFGIVGLPLETFAPYGASIKTIILFGRKLNDSEIPQKEKEIFIAEVESVGYDFKGICKEFEDLSVVEAAFIDFLSKNKANEI